MTTAATERAKLPRYCRWNALAPLRAVVRFSLDNIHDLFYNTSILGSVDSLTSRLHTAG
jgi:hypothetical protein